jgi:hypothetical protein
VQDTHQAISARIFDQLLRVPGLAVPTRIVQGVHDAVTLGVCAAVRQGGAIALSLTGRIERIAVDPRRTPGPKRRVLRSALNGAVGDALVRCSTLCGTEENRWICRPG